MQTEDSKRSRAGRPRDRYTTVAIALHWLIAAVLLTNIWYGWQIDDLRGMALFKTMQFHKSLGITVLALTLARLAWRLTAPPPVYDPPIRPWERRASKVVHLAFYGIMLGLPLTGWAIVSLSHTNIPTLLYDTIPWPHLGFLHDLPMAQRRALEDPVIESHHVLVKITYALLVLHVGGALKHAFVDRDGVAFRMIPLPFLRSKAS
jgi:cytochrome b561